MSSRGVAWALGLGVAASAAIALVRSTEPDVADAEPSVARLAVTGPPAPRTAKPKADDHEVLLAKLASARWIAAGGGAWPDSTQVQIEQDVGLAATVFGSGGVVLFGAGADAPVVQVQRAGPGGDDVAAVLADLFAPRGGRDAEYRVPAIAVDGAATEQGLLDALRTATAREDAPLLVYLAGHGEAGVAPRDNFVALWAGSQVTATELATAIDGAPRGVRLVATTCFSGGFAELAFTRADETAGATADDRCGLFAATWDLEASGCDPNPDRSVQQGYGLHFLEALRGRDRHGVEIDRASLDLDGDGAIGLLDAHTRVRIATEGADVPTTTSERWLRHAAPTSGEVHEVALPEEDAVIAALAARTGLPSEGDAAAVRLTALEESIRSAQQAVDDAQLGEDEAWRAAAAELLARWPVLDDPWHPAFAATLRSNHAAIAEVLARSPAIAAYRAARDAAVVAANEQGDHVAAAAPVERLVRAIENKQLAGRLAHGGGAAWATWQRLRACERWAPTVDRVR